MPGSTFFPNLSKIITFAAAPLVLTPFVRDQLTHGRLLRDPAFLGPGLRPGSCFEGAETHGITGRPRKRSPSRIGDLSGENLGGKSAATTNKQLRTISESMTVQRDQHRISFTTRPAKRRIVFEQNQQHQHRNAWNTENKQLRIICILSFYSLTCAGAGALTMKERPSQTFKFERLLGERAFYRVPNLNIASAPVV